VAPYKSSYFISYFFLSYFLIFLFSFFLTYLLTYLLCVITGNTERLILYTVIAVCLGVVALLLAVIVHLRCRGRSQRRHRLLHSSSSNSYKKYSSGTRHSSTFTQTAPENASLLPPDSPDQSWITTPTRAASWGSSPDGPSPRLADPSSSSPSTLRSLPLRVHSGPGTVGGDPVWTTMDRQRPQSPNAGLYTNPYRHDTFRTIDSRSSKSQRK